MNKKKIFHTISQHISKSSNTCCGEDVLWENQTCNSILYNIYNICNITTSEKKDGKDMLFMEQWKKTWRRKHRKNHAKNQEKWTCSNKETSQDTIHRNQQVVRRKGFQKKTCIVREMGNTEKKTIVVKKNKYNGCLQYTFPTYPRIPWYVLLRVYLLRKSSL